MLCSGDGLVYVLYYVIYYNRYAQVFNEDCLIKLG